MSNIEQSITNVKGEITALKDEITALKENDLKPIKTKIKAYEDANADNKPINIIEFNKLENRRDNIEIQLTSLNNQLTSLNNQLTSLNNQLTEIQHEKNILLDIQKYELNKNINNSNNGMFDLLFIYLVLI